MAIEALETIEKQLQTKLAAATHDREVAVTKAQRLDLELSATRANLEGQLDYAPMSRDSVLRAKEAVRVMDLEVQLRDKDDEIEACNKQNEGAKVRWSGGSKFEVLKFAVKMSIVSIYSSTTLQLLSNHSKSLAFPNHHPKERTKQLEDDLASARAMLTNALTEREAYMERSSKVADDIGKALGVVVQSLQTNTGGLLEGLARYITNHARQRRRLRQSTLEVRGVIVQAEETALAAAGQPRISVARTGMSVGDVEPGADSGSQDVGNLLDYLESMGDTFAASFEAAKQVRVGLERVNFEYHYQQK